MKIKNGLLSAALLSVAVMLFESSNAFASDPIGVYAFVDRVVFEPNESKPERAQIWGGFALAEGRGDTYAPAKRGYMYFTIKPGNEEVSRKEWADLKSLAGTGQIVAFSSRYQPKGTVRAADAKPENPDVYVTEIGLTKVSKTTEYPPIADLTKLKKDGASK